jgi:DNA modification methylase
MKIELIKENWKEKFLNKLIVGDSRELLKKIPDNSVHLVITSPPYFQQRNYGVDKAIGNEATIDEYLHNLLLIFHECVRIVREDGHIVFNLGDKYKDGSLLLIPWRFALQALEKEPVKLINVISWIKMNPTPRQYKKRLVNATEPFFIFTKSNDYYFDLESFMSFQSLLKKRKSKQNSRIGQKYFKLIEQSNLTPEQKKRAKEELENVINEVKEGKIAGFRMKIKGIHALPFGGQEGGRKLQLEKQGYTIIRLFNNDLKKDVIESSVETIRGIKHPAIFPEFIITELIKLLSPPGGIVLDPFVGSGTTAIAAKKTGRYFIGIDINPAYIKYARERLEKISQNTYEIFV